MIPAYPVPPVKQKIMYSFVSAFMNLFRKPVTQKYPSEKTFIPDDYRGLIVFEESLCIWCRRCEMVCPPGAIVFSQDMGGKQTYHFNRAVCIYCGECVHSCPKEGALIQSGKPAPFALKAENINNGWNQLYADALASRGKICRREKTESGRESAGRKRIKNGKQNR